MSTNGFVGFAVRGDAKITYNHCDSYPAGLGVRTLGWLRRHLLAQHGRPILHPEVAGMPARLRMVEADGQPTEQQRAALAAFTDPRVGGGTDWYATVRRCQGDLDATLRAGYLLDGHGFPLDSTFCQWGYLIDADAGAFDVYQGSQRRPATAGRWAGVLSPREDCWPVQRIWTIPFAGLPDDDAFLRGVEARRDAAVPS